ncbi:MAG: mechanosensitive ion channel family protein [Nanohaloarchaea archaeon]|nr:mechanosensitive ion channel family protein [Candidatus Nanohaloarchaea archaeon]
MVSLPPQLTNKIELIGFSISPQIIIVALLVVFGGWVANKISNVFIQRAVKRRGGDLHAAVTGKKISAYIIYTLTFIVLLGVFGVPLTSLGAVVGLVGLGLSFALKDMIANFISGVFILANGEFKIGDQIEVAGEEGTIKDIKIRATDIKTFDGRKVIVPNSQLYSDVVINNTAYDERRFEVVVGIGYDDDIEKAKELAFEALEEAEGIEAEPEPQVLVNELGGSSVNLKLRGWTKPTRASQVKASSELTQLVKEKYDGAGIDIPYPIRTVYMNEE